MQIFKKEKRVSSLALDHIDKTGECLSVMSEAVKAFLSGDLDVAGASHRVNDLEAEADRLLREIRELLYSGAYLPVIRADIYRLMSAVDDVANKAEDCLDFVNFQQPIIADEYHSQIIAIADLTEGEFAGFRKALEAYFAPKGKIEELRKHTRKVSELESLIDDNERDMTGRLFESSLELSVKLHFRQFLSELVRISDVIEDAADELELVSLKSIV